MSIFGQETGGMTYKDGERQGSFVNRNAFGKEGWYGAKIFSPTVALTNAFKGRHYFKKQQRQYEARKDAAAKSERETEYYNTMAGIDKQQGETDALRQEQLNKIDTSFANDADLAEVENAYQGDIGNASAGLGEKFSRQAQKQGFSAVRRGVQGGSNDAEQQADLSSDYQSALIDANQSALGRRSSAMTSRLGMRSNLRRSVLTDDPNASAAFQTAVGTEDLRSERANRMQDYYNAFADLRQQSARDLSRNIGGMGSNLADSYELDQNAKGSGYRGLY